MIRYWSVTCDLVVCRGGELDADGATNEVDDVLQMLINTGRVFGAAICETREVDGGTVDPLAVTR